MQHQEITNWGINAFTENTFLDNEAYFEQVETQASSCSKRIVQT
jgi:hypothetical protein